MANHSRNSKMFGDRYKSLISSECSAPPRPKKTKLWIIERRYTGELDLIAKKWETHRRYANQKDRDKAFATLTAEHIAKNGIWEYRKVD